MNLNHLSYSVVDRLYNGAVKIQVMARKTISFQWTNSKNGLKIILTILSKMY